MQIDFDTWTRRQEVANYAAGHDISIPEAIERLVNQGLSHEGQSWL